MLFRTAVASLLIVASAYAAEDYWISEDLSFVDIRLGYGMLPKPDTYKVDVTIDPDYGGGDLAWTDTVDHDQAQTLSYSVVGGTIAPFGPLFGIEMVYAYDSQKLKGRTIDGVAQTIPNDPSSLQYRTFGGNVLGGVGLALNRQIHLEGLAVLGIGAMDLDFADGFTDGKNDGEGWYWDAGLRGGIYFTWRRLVIGALAEVNYMSYRANANWLDARSSVEDTVTGVGGRLEIGYHIQ